MPKKNPANAGRGQGSEIVVCFPARDCTSDNPTISLPQSLAASRLSRRYGLSPATAAAVAQLAGIGGAHA